MKGINFNYLLSPFRKNVSRLHHHTQPVVKVSKNVKPAQQIRSKVSNFSKTSSQANKRTSELSRNIMAAIKLPPNISHISNNRILNALNRREYNTQSDLSDADQLTQPFTMQKVFWDNPYQHTLMTKVFSVEGNTVLFDKTIAYSFSGGQESDKATVNGIPILDSRMEGNLIYYVLPDNHGLTKGQEVKMEIDWPRRYRLMRLHFAAELVLEIVTQKFKLEKVGARITENKSRVDFIFTQHISCLFDEILGEYNKIINGDKTIEVGYSNVRTQRRFWKIADFAQVPCGGTHVQSTGEVGYMSLKRVRGGKSVERIEILPLDNSVRECTFFAHKNYKPILPDGLEFIKIDSKNNGLFQSLGVYLNEDPLQIQKDILRYIKQHPEIFCNDFIQLISNKLIGMDLDIDPNELKYIYALSLIKRRQVAIIVSGGAQLVNNEIYAESNPIFIYYTAQKQYHGLKLTGEKQPRDILQILNQKYCIFTDTKLFRVGTH